MAGQRVTRFAAIISPIVIVFFAACGGDDKPPPPLKDAKSVTAQIMCADAALKAALNKCKDKISDAMPLILQAKDQNQALSLVLAAGQKAAKEKAAALAAYQAENQQKVQKGTMDAMKAQDAANAGAKPAKPNITVDPNCTAPIKDPDTSCKDDIITSLLLWKSAHKSDGELAINDPQYQQYLMQKLKSFLSQSAGEMQAKHNLTPNQLGSLASNLQSALATNAPAGTNSGALINSLNGGSTARGPDNRLSYRNDAKPFYKPKPTSESRGVAAEAEPTREEAARARLSVELVSTSELRRAKPGAPGGR